MAEERFGRERDLGFEGVGAVEDLQSGEGFESLGLGEVG